MLKYSTFVIFCQHAPHACLPRPVDASVRQCRVLHRAQQGSVLLYTTAATQMQGARLTAGHRRRSFFFTTFETLTIFLSALEALQAGPSHDSLACSQRVSVDGFVCALCLFFALTRFFLLALRACFALSRFFYASLLQSSVLVGNLC